MGSRRSCNGAVRASVTILGWHDFVRQVTLFGSARREIVAPEEILDCSPRVAPSKYS